MTDRVVTWILVADDRGARLLRGRASGSGRARQLRLEPVAEMRNPWAELDIDKSATSAAPVMDSERQRRRAEFLQRYAVELCRWLAENAHELEFSKLEVFASARLTGALRREYPPDLAEGIREHQLDLGRVPHSRLESHPALFDCFRSAAS